LRRILGENIKVMFKFAMQPLIIHADATMLDQVLMNLAVNARDAMPKGGQLVIETTSVKFDETVVVHSPQARPGSFVCLSVSDNGSGIPAENLPRIFEPFFTTKTVGKGTGMGLATVYGIVQQHKGWINVYSEVGHGTTFRIYIPQHDTKPGSEGGQHPLTAMRGGDETILIVEDERTLRSSIRGALTKLGYCVLESANAADALEIWKQHGSKIHLLLTDIIMPGGMTGKELAGRLTKENPKLKVIYMSGYIGEIAGADFEFKEGVNFLTKPFGKDKLAQIVRDNLDAISVP
jgi:CheY-like chemotaxis protein